MTRDNELVGPPAPLTAWIPAGSWDAMSERIDKLNRRAEQMGIAARLALWDTGRTEQQVVNYIPVQTSRGIQEKPVYATFRSVSVTGGEIRLAGWTFVARIEHLSTGSNLFSAAPGRTVPLEYLHAGPDCDHCGQKRQRKDTFLVEHDDGSVKQVGSTCLRDFLGHAVPTGFASWFAAAGDEDGLFGGFPQPELEYRLDAVLPMAAAVIREIGWRSKGQAYDEGGTPTADHVCRQLFNRKYLKPSEIIETVEQDEAAAETAAAWAAARTDEECAGSNYLLNLRTMAREGLTTLRGMGIAVSMVRAYQRSMEKERADRKAAARAPCEHVGEIGVRREFTLTCHRIFETEGNYGVTGTHKMTDPDGNELTWFASGGTQWMEEGRTYRAKATVKKHDEYRGTKQTIVNRLKIIEEIKP